MLEYGSIGVILHLCGEDGRRTLEALRFKLSLDYTANIDPCETPDEIKQGLTESDEARDAYNRLQ